MANFSEFISFHSTKICSRWKTGGELLPLKEYLCHRSINMVELSTHLASVHKRKMVNNL
jgi:hypothetical protein